MDAARIVMIVWEGIEIEVTYKPKDILAMSHLELRIPSKARIPVTETGYRSHFFGPVDPELSLIEVEQMFREWLDAEAAKPAWREHCRQSAQLNLF